MTTDKKLSKGQLAYEQKRAQKAGKSLEGWLHHKEKQAQDEAKKAAPPAPRKKGLLSRLLDKAHKPI